MTAEPEQPAEVPRLDARRSGFRTPADATRYLTALKCRGERELTGATRMVVGAVLRQYHPHGRDLTAFPLDSRFAIRATPAGYFAVAQLAADGSLVRHLRLRRLEGETAQARLSSACRIAVEDQTDAARAAYWAAHPSGVAECPVLHLPMTPGTSDVDHAPPWLFAHLVERFALQERASGALSEHGAPVRQHTTRDAAEFDLSTRDGAALHLEFRELHERLARLRVVSRLANRVVLPAEQRAGS